MPITISWSDVALRLALGVLAGALFGINRTERGRPAGMRTMLLVCLAADIAMLQVNQLLSLAGRPANSFVMNDLMRLPLGILSGMGFIGAGTIIRRDTMVQGITTAATLWFVTVLGLCFGGGQIGLGLVAGAIGLIVLWGLEWIEDGMNRDRTATFILTTQSGGPTEKAIRAQLQTCGYLIRSWEVTYVKADDRCDYCCSVHWRGKPFDSHPPAFLNDLATAPGVVSVQWKQ